jgi:hypothetical protein
VSGVFGQDKLAKFAVIRPPIYGGNEDSARGNPQGSSLGESSPPEMFERGPEGLDFGPRRHAAELKAARRVLPAYFERPSASSLSPASDPDPSGKNTGLDFVAL